MKSKAQPRLMPFVIVVLCAITFLKLMGLYVGFSESAAQEAEPGKPAVPTMTDGSTDAGAALPERAPGEVERRILEKLASRRKSLDEREEKLALREEVIAAAEAKLQRNLEALSDERSAIEALRNERAANEAEEIAVLVSTFEKMKVRDAAVIFDDLDEDVLLRVASQMRTQALAGVMANMRPENARILTQKLARQSHVGETDNVLAQ